jgi:outer membrane biosynthesis protein TonB
MAFNEQKNRNQARIWTVTIHVLLLLWFAFSGLKYQDPPPEDGIAINFGFSDDGFGDNTQAAPVTPPPPAPETPVEETPPVQEEVVTQDVEDAPVIEEPKEEPKKETPKEPVKEQPKETPIETPQPDPEPEPDPQPTEEELERQRKADRLNRMFNTNNKGSGEGETQGGGDQGDLNGNPLSPNRAGNGGIGNSGDYYLGNRKPINKVKAEGCQAEGVIVVKIRVNRQGKVIAAEPGIDVPKQKSRFTDSCLLAKAKDAALKMKWTEANSKDPDTQVGYVIVRFTVK